MFLTSINVATPELIDLGNGPERTAIAKRSVTGPVSVGPEGLDGDQVADTRHHGGADQAIYVYTVEDYRHWEGLLGRELSPGIFGENLTVDGFSSGDVFVGDRLRVGTVVIELTAPRIPCGTFSRRMGESADFVERFRTELRPGVYCRVIEGGHVTVGDAVTLLPGERTVSIPDVVRLWGQKPDRPTLERLLAAPIDERSRARYERALQR